jgi:hypothetical protein
VVCMYVYDIIWLFYTDEIIKQKDNKNTLW